jgi:hypothetical protein
MNIIKKKKKKKRKKKCKCFGPFFFQPYMGLGHLPKPFLGGLCVANQVVMKHAIIELKIKIKVHAIGFGNTTQHN